MNHSWPPSFALLPAPVQERLNQLLHHMEQGVSRYIGFPNALDLDVQECLASFLTFPINNIGDPFVMNAGLHTCEQEQEFLRFCMDLLNLNDPTDRWGYVTNGSTESNTYGLVTGRDLYPDALLFFSADSHYSLPKIAHLLRMEAVIVPSDPWGEIDYDALRDLLKKRCAQTGRAAVLCCNVGTTMRGAMDKPEQFIQICDELGIQRRHIHCDAALFGLMLPFLEGAPVVDFRLPIGSFSFSGHKFLGSPIPCGVVLTRKAARREFEVGAMNAEYVGSVDSTISGSRNGISVLALWLQLLRFGRKGLEERVRHCMEMVKFARATMSKYGIPCYHHPFSNILVFPCPSQQSVRSWMLATQGHAVAHIVLMPGTGPEKIVQFIEQIKDDAVLWQSAKTFRVPDAFLDTSFRPRPEVTEERVCSDRQ